MASMIRNLLSRLGGAKADDAGDAPAPRRDSEAVPIAGRRRMSPQSPSLAKVPVNVRHYDEEDVPAEEPSAIRVRGAAVGTFHCEPEAKLDESPLSSPAFDLTAAGETHRGMRRESNEDALLVLQAEAVYVVADGMGGHAGGQIASQLAIEAIALTFHEANALLALAHAHVPPRASELVESIGAANEAVHAAASKTRELAGMGTTVVAARFDASKRRLYVGHVGDSRCYRLRDGALEQLTQDHTMAELGVTGPERVYLSRAVGPRVLVQADVTVIEPRPGDVYLLCTDGLTKMVSDASICSVLLDQEVPADAATTLIGRANAAGGRDNVTALVIRVASPRTTDDAAVA